MTDIRDRGHPIRFGITTPQMWRSWEEMCDLWVRAEAAGWDGAFLVDHFLSDWDGEMGANLEAFTLIGALGRETHTIDVGTYVASVTHRPPAVLAKAAVTADHVTGGRFIFGVGAGWNEREHDAYGIEFPSPGQRVGKVGETLDAVRLLESQERTTYDGEYITLRDAPFEPKPVNGKMRILVGSRKPKMLGHLAAYGDMWDSAGEAADVERIGGVLDAACGRLGRDPNEIAWMHERVGRGEDATVSGLQARVDALAPVGVSYFLVNVWPKTDSSIIERLGASLDPIRRAWA